MKSHNGNLGASIGKKTIWDETSRIMRDHNISISQHGSKSEHFRLGSYINIIMHTESPSICKLIRTAFIISIVDSFRFDIPRMTAPIYIYLRPFIIIVPSFDVRRYATALGSQGSVIDQIRWALTEEIHMKGQGIADIRGKLVSTNMSVGLISAKSLAWSICMSRALSDVKIIDDLICFGLDIPETISVHYNYTIFKNGYLYHMNCDMEASLWTDEESSIPKNWAPMKGPLERFG
jgi:hypothetical protein